MPKLFAFYSQEAKEAIGDETIYHYILVTTGETVVATHISEDESGADYFWKDKKALGEVSREDEMYVREFTPPIMMRITNHRTDWIPNLNRGDYNALGVPDQIGGNVIRYTILDEEDRRIQREIDEMYLLETEVMNPNRRR